MRVPDRRALTSEVEYFDELTPDQVSKAQRVVAANALDAEDAEVLMMALGIHPKQVQEDEKWKNRVAQKVSGR